MKSKSYWTVFSVFALGMLYDMIISTHEFGWFVVGMALLFGVVVKWLSERLDTKMEGPE